MRDRSPSDTARGGHHQRISATPPVFPSYLLPSFNFSFLRRRRRPSSSITTTTTTGRLARLAPDTLRCTACSADLALSSQIVSKGFTGRYGRALLVAPPPSADADADAALLNIRLGRLENRQLVTGWHVVADISCGTCGRKLGWKYVDAKEKSQRYKVGKYILETERVTTYRTWGEVGDGGAAAYAGSGRDGSDDVDDGGVEDDDDDAVFDSADEDECDEVFAGTWDARAVARRRADMVAAAAAAAATRPDE